MKFSAIVMAASAAVMFAVGSTFAYSQTGAPIQVEGFKYVQGDTDDYDNFVDTGLTLTFKNVAQKAVDDVSFSIRDASGYQLGTVERHGTFSPGVNITRNFGMVKTKHKHGPAAKAVLLSATFSDGSTWPGH
jgi:hypothetical protein